jgi:hypothetical protein
VDEICDWCKEPIKRGEMTVHARNPFDNTTKIVHATCLKRWRQYWLAAKKNKR